MTGLLVSSGSSAKAVVDTTKDFLRCYKNHALTKQSITVPEPVYPTKSFSISLDGKLLYSPPSSTKLEISPLAYAVIEGESTVISELLAGLKQSMQSTQFQDEIDNALFLADFFGQEEASDLLLEYRPDPGRKNSSNGLHGAAGQGLGEEILEYIWFSGADPDVLDRFGGTPIMYAMQLPAPHDWEIIELLIEEGADPCYGICIGGVSWPYPDISKAMGKPDLTKLLEEAILEMSEDEETDVPSRC
ncbi:hypothetical protein IWW34DRAFT_894835 [Fusarium oxysporum f. sp. albedinis]|nr:hypothetical protein IWW34DRAFT_894835 [Fusarium oxysporum f. sp. albedinis]KAJ0130123.1 Cytochrome P450 10 [Fusarium oxysporum f. sp. albedinis]KAK2467980.1 hypothetical protein H9L39_20202 [Fusarium oxysporum f. sp. albedinis]